MTRQKSTSGLELQLDSDRRAIERRLGELLKSEPGIPERLHRAMAHSLLAGGKRLRPVLLLWTARAFGAVPMGCDHIDAACAIEMIHTYSLIHDDLPPMDDDVLRRGLPTCHVAFDEATAILAGDGLQALAMATLARLPRKGAELVNVLATAAGPGGMVGGQQRDLDAEGQLVTAAMVRAIHRDKTARLIAAPLVMGGILGGAEAPQQKTLEKAGLKLGLAFQAADDCLDVESDTATLGKTAGKDAIAEKSTWVRLEGLAAARIRTRRYGREGRHLLTSVLPAGPATNALLDLSGRLWNRGY